MPSRIRSTLTSVLNWAGLMLLVPLLGGHKASAQGTTVIISGTVTGPNAAVIVGASVAATTPDSVTRRVTTDERGRYRLIFMNGPATLHLTVTAPGYLWWSGDVRKVSNDDRIAADVTLRRDETADPSRRTPAAPAVVFSRAQLGPAAAIRIDVDSGDVMIHGVDGDQVVYRTYSHSFAEAVTDSIGMPKEIAPTGGQVLTESGLTLTPASGATTVLEVPRNLTIIRVHVNGAGGVRVSDFDGQISIQSASGDVRLDRITGPALVEARNGPITATLAAIPDRMNFLGHNGTIVVTLPADGHASVSTEAHQGLTFHDSTSHLALPAHAAFTKLPDLETYRVGMPAPIDGMKTSWIMNGGGASITVTSLNGDIIIRRAQAKRP